MKVLQDVCNHFYNFIRSANNHHHFHLDSIKHHQSAMAEQTESTKTTKVISSLKARREDIAKELRYIRIEIKELAGWYEDAHGEAHSYQKDLPLTRDPSEREENIEGMEAMEYEMEKVKKLAQPCFDKRNALKKEGSGTLK